MAAGLPVIVTGVGGIPDVVQDGVNGLVLDTPASDEIADAIRRLRHNPVLRAQLGDKNRAEAWEKYESGSMSSGIAVIYRQLAFPDRAA
jgi:glycosyltransferase involved in cell wall biosynthesis